MKRLLVLVAAGALVWAASARAATANYTPPSATVSVTPTSGFAFNSTDIATASLLASPVTLTGSVTFTTTSGGAGGSITVTPVNLASVPTGSTLDARDFTLTCKKIGTTNGFTPASPAALNGPTTCATLSSGKTSVTDSFSVELTLNATAAATVPFPSGSYQGTFTVTATAS